MAVAIALRAGLHDRQSADADNTKRKLLIPEIERKADRGRRPDHHLLPTTGSPIASRPLAGDTYCGWLFVKYLWVSETLRGRGVGRELMAAAEARTRERG